MTRLERLRRMLGIKPKPRPKPGESAADMADRLKKEEQ